MKALGCEQRRSMIFASAVPYRWTVGGEGGGGGILAPPFPSPPPPARVNFSPNLSHKHALTGTTFKARHCYSNKRHRGNRLPIKEKLAHCFCARNQVVSFDKLHCARRH